MYPEAAIEGRGRPGVRGPPKIIIWWLVLENINSNSIRNRSRPDRDFRNRTGPDRIGTPDPVDRTGPDTGSGHRFFLKIL